METNPEPMDGPESRKRTASASGPASIKRPRTEQSHAPTPFSERAVGIEEYIDAASRPAFHAIIKQRFTDFQVFEVDQHGQIQHITSLHPPATQPPSALEQRLQRELHPELKAAATKDHQQQQESSTSDTKESTSEEEQRPSWDKLDTALVAKLGSLFDEPAIQDLKQLWDSGPQIPPKTDKESTRDPRTVTTNPLTDKAGRTAAHALVRELFQGYLVTESSNKYMAKPAPAPAADPQDTTATSTAPRIDVRWTVSGKPDKSNPQKRNAGHHKDDHPPYLHFLLQKTNRDSHEALALLSRALQLPPGAGARAANGRGRGGRGGGHGGPSRDLTVAGTKDRRSVSVQRVSLLRRGKTPEQVWALANGLDTDFDSDIAGPSSGGRGGRGGGRGGRGRGRGGFHGPGGRDSPASFLAALKQRAPKGLRIAHLQYANTPFRLGDLSGNEFLITLRNVKLLEDSSASAAHDFGREKEIIAQAMDVLKHQGFINYYGMQRFGTSDLSTHELGIPLFHEDYKRTIELILGTRPSTSSGTPSSEATPAPSSTSSYSNDAITARALYAQGHLQKAYETFPPSYVAERAILARLLSEERRQGWDKIPTDEDGMNERSMLKRDWLAAFGAVPKTLRMMYVHAYQSYIWNKMVSERVRRFGVDKPVIGDYVFIDPQEADEAGLEEEDGGAAEVTDDQHEHEDGAANGAESNIRKGAKPKVKALKSEEEIAQYAITDVVMPLPGSEITFEPGSWLETLYVELLAADGLQPEDIGSSKQPEYALRGAYRKMLHQPRSLSYKLMRYTDTNIDLALSDEDRLLGFPAPPESEDGQFLALQIRMVLGTSAYATMALREVLKSDTSAAAQRELTLKSEDQAFAGSASSTKTTSAAAANASGSASERADG
ncbi:multisubstrate pseudouridine synthase 7 [Tilletia horrida]|nr:multisubstrate pseudouridine synthase 7 [Tilletia horrida]